MGAPCDGWLINKPMYLGLQRRGGNTDHVESGGWGQEFATVLRYATYARRSGWKVRWNDRPKEKV